MHMDKSPPALCTHRAYACTPAFPLPFPSSIIPPCPLLLSAQPSMATVCSSFLSLVLPQQSLLCPLRMLQPHHKRIDLTLTLTPTPNLTFKRILPIASDLCSQHARTLTQTRQGEPILCNIIPGGMPVPEPEPIRVRFRCEACQYLNLSPAPNAD